MAALETVLALQALAGERVAIELLAPGRHFTYQPLAVFEPSRRADVRRLPLAAIAADRGVRLHRDALARVLPDHRAVDTQDGARLDYDALVLALGARPVEAVRGALTFRGPRDAGRVVEVVERLRGSTPRRVVFVAPAGTTWALPLYVLALQTAAAVRESAARAEITVVTSEPAPLAAFGAEASAAMGRLLEEQGIVLLTYAAADRFADGRLRLGIHDSLEADCVIALPRLLGRRVRGLPSDALGFVPVDELTRVRGLDGVHAVGDAAAHRLKQGGLAAQQAAVAASVIAAAAGVSVQPSPYRPVLRWPPLEIAGRHLGPYLAAQPRLAAPVRSTASIPVAVAAR